MPHSIATGEIIDFAQKFLSLAEHERNDDELRGHYISKASLLAELMLSCGHFSAAGTLCEQIDATLTRLTHR